MDVEGRGSVADDASLTEPMVPIGQNVELAGKGGTEVTVMLVRMKEPVPVMARVDVGKTTVMTCDDAEPPMTLVIVRGSDVPKVATEPVALTVVTDGLREEAFDNGNPVIVWELGNPVPVKPTLIVLVTDQDVGFPVPRIVESIPLAMTLLVMFNVDHSALSVPVGAIVADPVANIVVTNTVPWWVVTIVEFGNGNGIAVCEPDLTDEETGEDAATLIEVKVGVPDAFQVAVDVVEELKAGLCKPFDVLLPEVAALVVGNSDGRLETSDEVDVIFHVLFQADEVISVVFAEVDELMKAECDLEASGAHDSVSVAIDTLVPIVV